ncbi:ABC transporter permease subunit [Microbacterium sp. SYP-A9085]|nr:ABC transporter permease subunit [Microbacterium sp. SYP-A9085]
MILLRRLAVALAVPVALILVWIVVASVAPNSFWPSPITIALVFPETWFHDRMLGDVVPTLLRLSIGYLAALGIGIPLSIAIGLSRRLNLLLEPVRDLLRAVPPTTLVPIMIIFAGIGDLMKVIVIFWGCFWAVLLNGIEGVRGVDEVQRDTARTYRVSRWRVTGRVILPAATPKIVAGARQALSIGIIMSVISEMFAASNGIGFNIIQFQNTFAIPEMWTGMLILGVMGIVLNLIFRIVERHMVLPWFYGMQETER